MWSNIDRKAYVGLATQSAGLHCRSQRARFETSLRTVAMICAVAISSAATAPTAQAAPKPCNERKGILGVSRVVEIDTKSGPRFGLQQYPEIDFLKPGEVVLTFDDGPLRRYTTKVLNALEAHCTKATFFMVGRMAVSDPDMVREIARRGHTVGTHTWSHLNQGRLGASRREREVELGISAVSQALGKPVAPFFRFPYLSDPKQSQRRLQARQIGIFSIDVDSKDYKTRSGSSVNSRILAGLKRKGKGILLFHDIQRSTASAISSLLNQLKRNGYKIVHIVAKEPTKTIEKYDILARKEIEKRKRAASSRPLVARSIVWPIAQNLPDPEPLTYTPKPKRTAKAEPTSKIENDADTDSASTTPSDDDQSKETPKRRNKTRSSKRAKKGESIFPLNNPFQSY